MLDIPLIQSLIENLLPQQPDVQTVAHYTRIGTLKFLIPASGTGWASAWATPLQFLNDRMELVHGLIELQKVIKTFPSQDLPKAISSTIENLLVKPGRLATDAFQMSFSGDEDELGQWRGYAANGMGCSVVTDVAAVKEAADMAGWVIYDPVKQTQYAQNVMEGLKSQTDRDLIERGLIAAASYMKHPKFQPEQEYRILIFPERGKIEFRESGDRLVPYVDFLKGTGRSLPIRKIIIGPGWQLASLQTIEELTRNHVVQGISRLLEARELSPVTIEPSVIPYDPR